MDILQELGKVALGSRLRRLSDAITSDAANLYQIYQVDIQPKWFPVFYLLAQQGESSITALAKSIGCSHPVVSQAVKEMRRAGLLEKGDSAGDGRVNVVRLSRAGRALVPSLQVQMGDVSQVLEEMFGQMRHDFWSAIEELEFLLEEKSLLARVVEQRKKRESQLVEIIEYTSDYREEFKRLNYEWIEKYFELEQADHDALDRPEEKILDPGGAIMLARYKGEIVGTCALINWGEGTFELAKMAVTPSAQGKSIGWMLGRAILKRARQLGAHKVFVESNTRLKPAISLYQKLGFKRVAGISSHYERCNIQMEQILTETDKGAA